MNCRQLTCLRRSYPGAQLYESPRIYARGKCLKPFNTLGLSRRLIITWIVMSPYSLGCLLGQFSCFQRVLHRKKRFRWMSNIVICQSNDLFHSLFFGSKHTETLRNDYTCGLAVIYRSTSDESLRGGAQFHYPATRYEPAVALSS